MADEEKTSKANKHIGTNNSKKDKGQEERRAQRLAMSDAPKEGDDVCILQIMSAWARIVTDMAGMYAG
jgi:hypothetical protein